MLKLSEINLQGCIYIILINWRILSSAVENQLNIFATYVQQINYSSDVFLITHHAVKMFNSRPVIFLITSSSD